VKRKQKNKKQRTKTNTQTKKPRLPASKEESTVMIKSNFKTSETRPSCFSSPMRKTGSDQKFCHWWGVQVCLCCCLNISSAEEETFPVNLNHKSQTLLPTRKTGGEIRSRVRVRKRRCTSTPVSSLKSYSSY